MAIVGGIAIILAVISLALILVSARVSDSQTAGCIKQAFENRYGEYFWFTKVDMKIDNGSNLQRVVRSSDPLKQIWIIESTYDVEILTAGGKSKQTVTAPEALVDISTGRVEIDRKTASALSGMGVDTFDWKLDLSAGCYSR